MPKYAHHRSWQCMMGCIDTPFGVAGAGSQHARNRKSQQDVAWLELGKGAAWWLGEYANVATGEFVGNPTPPERSSQGGEKAGESADSIQYGSHSSPNEMLAMQVRG